MKLCFKGVDISTEEKFIRYIKSLNKEIVKRNAKGKGPKEKTYDIEYLRKRYQRIISKEKNALFLAEHECKKCVYFQKLAKKCRACGNCLLEKITKGGDK